MLSIDDFTNLPPGAEVPEGRVGSCPKCGRSGVERKRPDGRSYLHSQTSEVLGDGMRIEPGDCCSI